MIHGPLKEYLIHDMKVEGEVQGDADFVEKLLKDLDNVRRNLPISNILR